MYIKQLEIENYKTFQNRQVFHFEQGFNLLLGPNNAGKTSVLEALSFDANLNQPHRSIRSIPKYGGKTSGSSEFKCFIESTYAEISDSVIDPFILPVLSVITGDVAISRCSEALQTEKPLSLKLDYVSPIQQCAFSDGSSWMTGEITNRVSSSILALQIRAGGRKQSDISHGLVEQSHQVTNIYRACQSLVYKFSAHRRPTPRSSSFSHPKLDSDALWLPYCINHLQTNDSYGHQILCEWVNRIFPSVKWVQSTSLLNEFEIRCLPEKSSSRRDDLAVPMSSMGTGIGNVLAMLYVVLTARTPQLIAIDEPNAFLHPKALRQLLGILETEGKQHQFLLTAHSADVLTSVSAKTISVLEFDGVATTVNYVSLHDMHQIKASLAELGIRVTDLHAKDRVLWVEGQTEELVMPEILRWACPEIAAGTAVLRVERTGTFSRKAVEPHEVASIYERLSTSSALVPPMVTILLDGEQIPQAKRTQVEDSSKGKLRYLPRAMLENYLLNPDAIAAALKENGEDHDRKAVSRHLKDEGLTEQIDLRIINGALVLSQVFSNISEARVEFRKTRDVQTMISFLIESDPQFLNPLREFLRKLFSLK